MTQMVSQSLVASAAILLLLVGVPHAIAQQPSPNDRSHQTPQQDEDVTLNQAKKTYAKRVAEVEQSNARIIEEALQKARRVAQKFKEDEIKAASTALLVAYDSAIQRAIETGSLEQASRLTAEKQSIEGLGISAPDIDPDQFEDKAIYKCVLGSYGRFAREVRYPVVNLSVPNRDLWSKAIQSKLRGRIDFFEINYKADAKLVVPEDGFYTLDIPGRGTAFEINGRRLSRGDVELGKGVYSVQIFTDTHGQPFLPDSFVRILRKGTNRELPLVNTGSDIKKFLLRTIDRQTVVELSGYRPEVVDPASLGGLSSANEITSVPISGR